jgi:hypothetical protein
LLLVGIHEQVGPEPQLIRGSGSYIANAEAARNRYGSGGLLMQQMLWVCGWRRKGRDTQTGQAASLSCGQYVLRPHA